MAIRGRCGIGFRSCQTARQDWNPIPRPAGVRLLPRRSHCTVTRNLRRRAALSEPYLAIQVVMMPRDTNPLGSIFGGVILSYIDQAGAIGARREVHLAGGGLPFIVTVALNKVEFHKPVLVGDVVRFLTRLVRIGR